RRPRSPARDRRGSVDLLQRPCGDSHRAAAPERGGRGPADSQAGGQDVLPVGEAGARDRDRPRDRRGHSKRDKGMDLELRRRFFAEEIEAVARLRSSAVVDALAAVPRERFLRPGPWTVLADADVAGLGLAPAKFRQTADADPARVYHNIGVAIDAE